MKQTLIIGLALMDPYDRLESEKTRIKKNKPFLIGDNQSLCKHGGLHPMIARKVKYIPGNIYNHMKEKL